MLGMIEPKLSLLIAGGALIVFVLICVYEIRCNWRGKKRDSK